MIFDDIVSNENIRLRAADIASYYDDLIGPSMLYAQLGVGEHVINGKTHRISEYELKKKTYLCLMSVNILEAIRFYVSFACSFAFAERKLMEGNAKIIRLIARDEALHLTGTQHLLNIMRSGQDDRTSPRSRARPSRNASRCSSAPPPRKSSGPSTCSATAP